MIDLPPGKFVGRNEYCLDRCPACDRREKFFYNIQKREGICHYCKVVVKDQHQFVQLVGGTLGSPFVYRPRPAPGQSARKSRLIRPAYWDLNAWDDPEARAYLRSRNIQEHDARTTPIWALPEERAIALEIDPIDSALKPAVLYRRYRRKDSKWISPKGTTLSRYGFGLRHIPPDRRTIVLVEGVFDVLPPGLLGYAVAMLGSRLQEWWYAWLKNRFDHVTIWTDPDRAGQEAATRIARSCKAWGIQGSRIAIPADPGAFQPDHPFCQSLRTTHISKGATG